MPNLKPTAKFFAPDSAAFGAEPNKHTSFITLGHPGTLPVLNAKVVEYAIKAGLALNCHIERKNDFSRKNYFYADLPKGYQITQYDTPICRGGYVEVMDAEGKPKKIGITQIHMEEDAGKSTHDQNPKFTLIDLNRAGIPLIEIVSEPDMRSADEAHQYIAKVRQILRFLDVCDGNMQEGSLRCDANISVRLKGTIEYGERTEVKNMNSLRFVQKAIEYEAKRQIDLIEADKSVQRQTRSFDDVAGTTFPLRIKEMENDYRYFPEPDLPPVILSEDYIAQIKANLPQLPDELVHIYTQQYGLSDYDAALLTETREIAHYFNETVRHSKHYKAVANWIIGPIKAHLNKLGLEFDALDFAPQRLAELCELTQSGKVSFSAASHQLLPICLEQPNEAVADIAKKMNLLMEKDEGALSKIIDEVLAQFPNEVERYHGSPKGKKLIGFFMGQIMRQAKGKADPKAAQKLLMQKLSKK